MFDSIINFFIILTPVFFIYWILSMVLLTFGDLSNSGEKFLEFMRYWIKPLFWLNFSYFVAAEALFSAVYWLGYVVSKISLTPVIGFLGRPLEMFYNYLFRLIPTSSGGDASVEVFLVFSILLFLIIMMPYIVVHFRLTAFFKKLIFKTIINHLGITEAKFITQKPGKKLTSKLVNALVAQDKTAREWILKTFEEHSSEFDGDPKKFTLKTVNADHMRWQLNNQEFDFWESKIQIEKKTPKRDKENKLSYSSDYHTCLDGLVVSANDFFTHGNKTLLYAIDSAGGFSSFRDEQVQGLLISIIEAFGRGGGDYNDESTSSLEDFPESLDSLKLDDPCNLKYVGIVGRALFLFAETRLDGTMFDFNQNLPITDNVDLFRQDLEFVVKHCQLADKVKTALQKLESENLSAIA